MSEQRTRPIVSWEQYLHGANVIHESFLRCRQDCATGLGRQKELIRELIARQAPQRIGCLGAGYLNDLPLGEMMETASEVSLVDWVPGISEQGFRWGLIEERSGLYSCLACSKHPAGERVCRHFAMPFRVPHQVCQNFHPASERPVWCEHYAPGPEPRFLAGDVTAGRATHFAHQAQRSIGRSRSPEQAVRALEGIVRECEDVLEPLEFPESQLDMVTSSMVMTQFDVEPFTYALGRLADRFGPELLERRRERLEPLLQRLRDRLFQVLMEGHAAELHRLVNRDHGVVFVATEAFRSHASSAYYFLVEKTAHALDILSERFSFEFDTLGLDRTLNAASIGDGESLVLNLVLRPH